MKYKLTWLDLRCWKTNKGYTAQQTSLDKTNSLKCWPIDFALARPLEDFSIAEKSPRIAAQSILHFRQGSSSCTGWRADCSLFSVCRKSFLRYLGRARRSTDHRCQRTFLGVMCWCVRWLMSKLEPCLSLSLSSGCTTRALEELGVRESLSAERKINSGYRWLCGHYDDDHKVDGDDVPDANGDDQVNLTAVRVITAVLTQGRFAGGQGQEYAQVPR